MRRAKAVTVSVSNCTADLNLITYTGILPERPIIFITLLCRDRVSRDRNRTYSFGCLIIVITLLCRDRLRMYSFGCLSFLRSRMSDWFRNDRNKMNERLVQNRNGREKTSSNLKEVKWTYCNPVKNG